MNTSVVNVKVNTLIKKEAQEVAKDLGLSLSALINGYLKQLVRNKTVIFSSLEEEPTGYLLEALRQSRKDIETRRVITFKNSNKALGYLDKMVADER